MAKKSFLDNPALKFIDIPQDQPSASDPEPEQPVSSEPKLDQQKKADDQTAAPEGFIVPEGYRLEKIVERRTKRIQLVIEPSLYNKMKAAANKEGISVNEYAIQALNEKLKNQSD